MAGRRPRRIGRARREHRGDASHDAVWSASNARARFRVRRSWNRRGLGSRAGRRQRGARGCARRARTYRRGARGGHRIVSRRRARPPPTARTRDPHSGRAHFGIPAGRAAPEMDLRATGLDDRGARRAHRRRRGAGRLRRAHHRGRGAQARTSGLRGAGSDRRGRLGRRERAHRDRPGKGAD